MSARGEAEDGGAAHEPHEAHLAGTRGGAEVYAAQGRHSGERQQWRGDRNQIGATFSALYPCVYDICSWCKVKKIVCHEQ